MVSAALAALFMACAGSPALTDPPQRPFTFERDVFAFANQLFWIYEIDPETGQQVGRARDTPVEFGQRCVVMAKAVRQFRYGATFDPEAPPAGPDTYRMLVESVLATSARASKRSREPVVIPGYADLASFSGAEHELLKDTLGATWRSYIQKGNWRMVFPFGPAHQETMSRKLLGAVEGGDPPIVHLVRFPKIAINHTVVAYAAQQSETEIVFQTYDPNQSEHPVELVYDRELRIFRYASTPYFAGGQVSAYEIYDGPFF